MKKVILMIIMAISFMACSEDVKSLVVEEKYKGFRSTDDIAVYENTESKLKEYIFVREDKQKEIGIHIIYEDIDEAKYLFEKTKKNREQGHGIKYIIGEDQGIEYIYMYHNKISEQALFMQDGINYYEIFLDISMESKVSKFLYEKDIRLSGIFNELTLRRYKDISAGGR